MANIVVVTDSTAVAQYLIDYEMTTQATPVVSEPTADDLEDRAVITTRRLPLSLLTQARGILEIPVESGQTGPSLDAMRAAVDDPQWYQVRECRDPEWSFGEALFAGMGDERCP